MRVSWSGRRSVLFWLALKTGFWTILTLGFYRFWMKTRMRRFYWSAIRPGGHPMEYVGDPFEKLLGFFIAVVVLTFYIGVVNLLLMFASFSLFSGNYAGYTLSFLGVIPLWFYARYRARRYVLGRTRWRGVRFGVEPAAWQYTWRALLHWALTLVTLGALWPRMTFYLEKFRIDRTFLGDTRLLQGGSWTKLYGATVPLVVALILSALYLAWIFLWQPVFNRDLWELMELSDFEMGRAIAFGDRPERLWGLILVVLGLLYGMIHYSFEAKRIMANHKGADGITFRSDLSPRRVFWIYNMGYTLAYFLLIFGVVGLVALGAVFMGFDGILEVMELEGFDNGISLPTWVKLAVLGLFYFSIFLMWSVAVNTFVTFPMMRHLASTLSLPDHDGLERISQRSRDDFAEAEGFSDALDLGAAI